MLAIRKMREPDLIDAAQLEQEIFADAWSRQALADTYEQQQALMLAALEDKKLIGYLISYYVLEEGEIARIAVSEEYRRKGVGARLLAEFKDLCLDNGISRLLLDVRESNVAAAAFYQEFGFSKDGIRKNFYTNPVEDGILMSCRIGK